jgi:GntR family transcriptional regulator / MocR family aminotransferase
MAGRLLFQIPNADPLSVLTARQARSVITAYPEPWHAPVVDQVVLSEFITEGHFARHIRRMREIYAEHLSVLLAEARRNLVGLLAISDVEAGLQTVGWLGGGLNAEAAAVAAARRNVDVTPVSRYELGRRIPEALQLGFAAVDKNEIRRGIRELTIALEGELHGV